MSNHLNSNYKAYEYTGRLSHPYSIIHLNIISFLENYAQITNSVSALNDSRLKTKYKFRACLVDVDVATQQPVIGLDENCSALSKFPDFLQKTTASPVFDKVEESQGYTLKLENFNHVDDAYSVRLEVWDVTHLQGKYRFFQFLPIFIVGSDFLSKNVLLQRNMTIYDFVYILNF